MDFKYEPDMASVLEKLVPQALTIKLYRALLESVASEQGARMSAMEKATSNAAEMIDRLTLFYNRTRQAVITKELMEIVSGAEHSISSSSAIRAPCCIRVAGPAPSMGRTASSSPSGMVTTLPPRLVE